MNRNYMFLPKYEVLQHMNQSKSCLFLQNKTRLYFSQYHINFLAFLFIFQIQTIKNSDASAPKHLSNEAFLSSFGCFWKRCNFLIRPYAPKACSIPCQASLTFEFRRERHILQNSRAYLSQPSLAAQHTPPRGTSDNQFEE